MRTTRFARTIAAALLLGACNDLPEGPLGAEGGPAENRAPGAPPLIDPLEMQFAEMEASVPGFAGWYFDRDGSAVVRVKDAGRQAQALERVGRYLDTRGQAGRGPAAARKGRPRMSARPAAWSFTELARFRQTIRENMPAGVTRLDVDEVDNVVAVGVRDEPGAQRFRGVAAQLGIPAAAVRVAVVPRAEPRADLDSYQRPIRAGLMHGFVYANILRRCAVTANGAYANNEAYSGYFTASHCSTTPFGSDGSAYYQPNTSYPIGTELYDPAPQQSVVCPSGATCRRSDALFVLYNAAIRYTASGYNTMFSTIWWQDPRTEIDGYYVVGGPIYSTPVGETLEKIGPETGWTWGAVTGTCIDEWSGYNQGTTPIWVLCSTATSIYSRHGDSGSPIFKWYGYDDPVAWAGLLWGGPGNNYDVSWHSSVYNIEYEFPNYTFWY
ncbi:MAG TPA: hypothetical protein VFR37_12940 [Longimicrobium sp.]|nr:hypothetical protein [Longimicrobium sp.]